MVFKYEQQMASGTRTSMISHDFTDKTSWWQNAVEVIGETLTHTSATPDYQTYSFSHTYIIDADKISCREAISTGGHMGTNIPHKVGLRWHYHKIYVDDVEVTSGYTINHENGTITFDSVQEQSAVVKADYFYATTSGFKVQATAGKKLRVYRVEVQFTDDVTILPITFRVWVGGATPFVANERSYFTMKDYLNESNLGYRLENFPFGETQKDIFILPWDYATTIDIQSSLGMYIELLPEDDETPADGSYATATIYAIVEDE